LFFFFNSRQNVPSLFYCNNCKISGKLLYTPAYKQRKYQNISKQCDNLLIFGLFFRCLQGEVYRVIGIYPVTEYTKITENIIKN
jgi:hypothetical protein